MNKNKKSKIETTNINKEININESSQLIESNNIIIESLNIIEELTDKTTDKTTDEINEIYNITDIKLKQYNEIKEVLDLNTNIDTDIDNSSTLNNQPIIKIQSTNKLFKSLNKANSDNDNACYDVIATSIKITDNYVEYGLGFKYEFNNDWKLVIYPRSSISKYNLMLANGVGICDSSYRDEVKVRFKIVKEATVCFVDIDNNKYYSVDEVFNDKILMNKYKDNVIKPIYADELQSKDIIQVGHRNPIQYQSLKLYEVGDTIAQISFERVHNATFKYVDNNESLSETRRNGGFGSTGK